MFDESVVLNKLNKNAFTMPQYSFGIEFSDAFVSIARNTSKDKGYKELDNSADIYNLEEYKKFAELVLEAVPEFQRDNDKWTVEMQSNFMRNVIMGMKGRPIVLYSIDGTKTNCKILDGLQRLTALYSFFFEDKMSFEIQGNKLSAQEMRQLILDKKALSAFTPLCDIVILEFKSELEAVEHYIEINENISHSKEDIQRAIEYRDKLLSEM